MRGAHISRHTIRSHGFRVARAHMQDWLVVVLLGALEIVLNVIHPFHRFVGKDMMNDLKYPLQKVTIPTWTVGIYAVLLPFLVFLFFYFRRRDVYDLHDGLLGLVFSVLITGVITDTLKNAAGRPRPDFFWRCFPDGNAIFDQRGSVLCNGRAKVIKDGYKSFPSGHTSWSFCGLVFFVLYLSGKFQAFDHNGQVSKLIIVLLPPLVAAVVGISLVDNYWHHWQDVLVGGIIGTAVATICYLHFFPPPCKDKGWAPYAYFRALEAESRFTLPTSSVDEHNAQVPQQQQQQATTMGV